MTITYFILFYIHTICVEQLKLEHAINNFMHSAYKITYAYFMYTTQKVTIFSSSSVKFTHI